VAAAHGAGAAAGAGDGGATSAAEEKIERKDDRRHRDVVPASVTLGRGNTDGTTTSWRNTFARPAYVRTGEGGAEAYVFFT